MRRLLYLLAFASFLTACDTGYEECPDDGDCAEPGVLIYAGNQGNFADNNGTITTYGLVSGDTEQNAVPNLNALVQHLSLHADRLYVLLNFNDSFSTGRGRIDVVDPNTNTRIAQVDVSTPRGIAFTGTQRAYVTNLYANTVTPVDFAAGSTGTPIPVGLNPEGIVAVGGRLYVANFGFGFATTLSVIDPATNAVVETREMDCDGPRTLGVDAEDEVWVFCTGKTVYDNEGNVIERTNGEVVVLDGATGAERARLLLTDQIVTASLGQDALVSRTMGAWAVRADGALLHFDTAANALVGAVTPELPAGHLIGGIGVLEEERLLLIGAVPPDFISAGRVVLVNTQGQVSRDFPAGLIPSTFALGEEQ
ncbi:MAG TPA: hypothetical protein VD962_00935 [Rubricoccaceae bacterium]|nr:hypothetical protein [Rubricoccaceae bacterium]